MNMWLTFSPIRAWIGVSTMIEAFVATWDRQRYMKHVGLRVQVEYNIRLIQMALIEQLGMSSARRYKLGKLRPKRLSNPTTKSKHH